MTAALLALVVFGGWSGSAVAGDTRAHVRFDVSGAFVQPSARVDLRGCRATRTVHIRRSFGLVAAPSGRFDARSRFSPPGRALKVTLRFRGHFRSPTRARGVVRGRLRYAGGRICRIPRLRWTAVPITASSPAADAPDEADDLDDAVIDDPDLEDGDYEEDEPGEGEGDEEP